ncbi:CesT family type III secretion system chaperone [Robbsia sp. Bb-Pol-6]|uniref:CesT family type III secretion system chaperone n=1 Tax=Robbsia betulipollinis TaxID=2981849 RepID=A0ABT3ZMX2_9BURK|nr:CesT family type III secretion system chaperone [Robbsia betulipollinis]MCY0387290.1 CesT family type III secretion system chaperone [Robbsia betulipollinis]
MSTACAAMLRSYLAPRALPLPDAEGRATVIFDGRHRVHLQAGSDGRVVVRARLIDLPPFGARRDALLVDIARRAAVAASATRQPVPACVVDAREEAVWLQLRHAPDGTAADFATALGGFVDWLTFWKRHLEWMSS